MGKFKLPEPFKTKWIKALRSGRYKQEEGTLYDPHRGGYCCLGVGERICGVRKEFLADLGRPKDISIEVPEEKRMPTLPLTIVNQLAAMNDGTDDYTYKKYEKQTFKQIANWIEENL